MLSDGDVPLGFGMTLTQKVKALDTFSRLPEQQKRSAIRVVRNANSLEEMLTYVERIAGGSF